MNRAALPGLILASLLFIICTKTPPAEDPESRVLRIHNDAITIDSHLDTPMNMLNSDWDIGERHDPKQFGSGKLDLPRMKEGGLDCAVFAVFVSQAVRNPAGYASARTQASQMIEAIESMVIQHPDLVEIARSADDIRQITATGRRAVMMGMENGYPIGRDLFAVKSYYDRGIRYITLCHSRNNDICDSSTDPKGSEWGGLSPFGVKVVREMNRLGILVDVSHISDKAFFDVLEYSKAPVIASHSCCRALYDNARNLSDSMLTALAFHGGVVQINLCSFYLKKLAPNPQADSARKVLQAEYGSYYSIEDQTTRNEYLEKWFEIQQKYPGEKASLSDLADHIDHAVQVAGIDHVGIGSDFDGGAGIEGCMDVSEMPNITRELVRRGYSDDDIRKIWGENFLRVLEAAEELRDSEIESGSVESP